MTKLIRRVFQVLAAIVALGLALVLWFRGQTTITATLDDQPLVAEVYIQGAQVGQTPYTDRLWFGCFEVWVRPPRALSTQPKWVKHFCTLGLGQEFNASFTRLPATPPPPSSPPIEGDASPI